MIAAVRVKTKFKFGDHVLVQYGFHRGMSGKVTTYMPREIRTFMHSKEIIEYHVKTDIGNLDILVDEAQIQLVGAK